MGTAHQRIETIGFVPFRPITVYLKSSETMSDMSVKEVPGMRPQRCTIRDTKNHRFDDDEPLLGSWPLVQVAYFLLKNGFKGSEVNEAKGLWWTYPLHVAVKQNNPYVTSKLLFFGADPTTTNIWGQTAYGLAKRQRKTQMVKIFESQRNRAVWGTAINSNTSRY